MVGWRSDWIEAGQWCPVDRFLLQILVAVTA